MTINFIKGLKIALLITLQVGLGVTFGNMFPELRMWITFGLFLIFWFLYAMVIGNNL